MAYNIPPIPNRYRKKRTHHSGLFLVSITIFAFIVVGLAISLTIRACARHQKTYINNRLSEAPIINEMANVDEKTVVEPEPETTQDISTPYILPDSIISICMPKPIEGVSEMILQKTTYIVSYNKDTKLPNWVAWNLSANHTDGPYRRLSNFYEDLEVPSPRASNEDYRGSGWSRGHMCPAGDNKWDAKAMYDTFSLVNVCPQNANLNSGIWNSIEIDCRRWARRFGDVYIVCGPIYLNREHKRIGENQIVVPEVFFKVILCLKDKPKAIGFIVRNNEGTKKKDQYVNTVDEVERITGIDFFPALPDDIENEVEAKTDIGEW